MGERGSPVLDIVEQIVGDFEDALVHNVLVGSGSQWRISFHRGHGMLYGQQCQVVEVELTERRT